MCRPSHLSRPLIGYLAAPQLSIHLSERTHTHARARTRAHTQNAIIDSGFVSLQDRKTSLPAKR